MSRWIEARAPGPRPEGVDHAAILTECFEEMGGVPHVVLVDRMGCLKGGVVANVVVPTSEYVRFPAHFGFRRDGAAWVALAGAGVDCHVQAPCAARAA